MRYLPPTPRNLRPADLSDHFAIDATLIDLGVDYEPPSQA